MLDPTAGGGSIPFEASRLGLRVVANDLNPVAWLLLKATMEFPAKYGQAVLKRYQQLSKRFLQRAEPRLIGLFPPEPPGVIVDGYLWSHTIHCPYCGGLVPLSPNWRLDAKETGVRLAPNLIDPEDRHCTFGIVENAKDQSPGTVKQDDGLCPYPDCGRVIDGDEVKKQGQAGQMGEQLYAVVYKQTIKVGVTKAGKDKFKSVRGFRAPRMMSRSRSMPPSPPRCRTGRRGMSTRPSDFSIAIVATCENALINMYSITGRNSSHPVNFWATAPALKSSTNWSPRFENGMRGRSPIWIRRLCPMSPRQWTRSSTTTHSNLVGMWTGSQSVASSTAMISHFSGVTARWLRQSPGWVMTGPSNRQGNPLMNRSRLVVANPGEEFELAGSWYGEGNTWSPAGRSASWLNTY